MRSNIAKALSILGVVAAGSAATAINTQALQSRADATVGDATALLAPKSASVPTPTITIFKTATPVVAGPVAPKIISGPNSNSGGTKNPVTTELVTNAQPSQQVQKPAADETSNRQSAPKVKASPAGQTSHTSTGGSSYTSGNNENKDSYDDDNEDREDSHDSEDREDDNGGDSDDD